MAIATSRLSELVDLDHGLISREIFVNDDIYRMEQEQIFARAWLFVGHESQVPHPGDYYVSRMGEESVILSRDRQGEIHVFLNTCRHRGMKVCRYDEGNALLFTCPFHGWSYDTSGKLVGVPQFADSYHGRLDKSQWGLIQVAQLANYHGSIWANWDPQAPSFQEFLGDYDFYLRMVFAGDDGRDGGSEVLGGVHKWRMPCNWKFPASSFGADAAHGAITHRSTTVAAYGPQGDADATGDRHGARTSDERQRLEVWIPGLAHGAHVSVRPASEPYVKTWQTMPELEDYFRRSYEEKQRRLNGQPKVEAGSASVWPNASTAAGLRRTIVVWHPHGTQMTECHRFYLVDKNAPQDAKDALRRYHMRYSGPTGMTEQDDMENWNYASAASKGVIARRHPYNYMMEMLPGRSNGPVPGMSSRLPAEHSQRARFARWLEFMESASWDDIYPKRPTPRLAP